MYSLFVGARNILAVTGNRTTRIHATPYRADNGNFGKFGATYFFGTVFAPKQCLYQKVATGIESLKMYSLCRCKKRTSGYG